MQEVLAQITWYHNVILMDKVKDINKPVGVSEYKLLQDIPEYLQLHLPKAEEIELHIKDIEEIEKQQDNEE